LASSFETPAEQAVVLIDFTTCLSEVGTGRLASRQKPIDNPDKSPPGPGVAGRQGFAAIKLQ
jgi:hypothetical protein